MLFLVLEWNCTKGKTHKIQELKDLNLLKLVLSHSAVQSNFINYTTNVVVYLIIFILLNEIKEFQLTQLDKEWLMTSWFTLMSWWFILYFYCHISKDFTICYRLSRQYQKEFILLDI